MNEQELKALGHPEYWNNRYNEADGHEWFRSFKELQPLLVKELPEAGSNPKIIHLGCGDSTLPADLYDLGYTNQLSVDFSDVVIEQMKSKYPHLNWQIEDVRHLSLEDGTFDFAVDKGTMDAMIHGSQWNPPVEVQENVRKYGDEVARVLKPGGKWLYITFRQPHFVKPQLERDGVWEVRVEKMDDGDGTFEYFAFVMTRSGDGGDDTKEHKN